MLRRIVTIGLVLWGVIHHGSIAHADELQDISSNIASSPELISKGKLIYTNNCAMCHGPEGKGDGPAAGAFNPKPRNFTAEKFKQGSSPSGAFFTVTHGLGSMPSFASMSAADRLAVVHYVLSLSPNREKDTPESLAKIGLDPQGKPLAGFKGAQSNEIPVEFIIERMAVDGDIRSLEYAEISKKIAAEAEAKKQAAAVVPKGPDLERGAVLFQYCQICHGNQGEGSTLSKAPQIAGQDADYLISQLKKFQQGIRGAHPLDVNGLKMRPMSRILRTEDDVINVANYVSQMKPHNPGDTLGAGNPQKGQAAFGVCIACHGPDAKGMKAMSAPSLAHLSDWYILEQINKFKAGYRGADPRDATGATMRGMAATVTDEQVVKDIVSYIRTLNQ